MRTTNVLKALAIFAVILIHSLSSYGQPFNLAFDATLRFCVPLFVALSGFGLAKKYQEQPFTLKDFFLRRLVKLLPWYIFWSAVFVFVLGNHWQPFWKTLVWGQADYQMYFVPMIAQLYLLFPVLFFLCRRWPKAVLFLALGAEILWFLQTSTWPDQKQYVSPATWIFYFVTGIVIAQEKFFALSKKYTRLLFFLLIVGLVISTIDAYQIANSGANLLVATRFTKLPILLFAGSFIAWAVTLDLSSPLLEHIGQISYVVFLSHTIVLRQIPHWPYPLYALAAIVFSLLLAEVAWQLAQRIVSLRGTRVTKQSS